MGFQIVRAEDRAASMIEWFTGICRLITDFTVGSKIRSKFETIAVEMESQDFAWYQSLKKAIPIAIYKAYNFELVPAQYATGDVVFSIPIALGTDLIIPAETYLSTPPPTNGVLQYYTTAATTITAGQLSSPLVPIICNTIGSAGNLIAGQITVVVTAVAGADNLAVTNPTAIASGADRETEEQRRLRFLEYIATLPRGIAAAVEYGAKTAAITNANGDIIESVHDAIVYEPFMTDNAKPVGVFECYIYNGSAGTSDELITEVQKTIDGYYDDTGLPIAGYKAAGTICNVIKATEIILNVTVTITMQAGTQAENTQTKATEIIDAYILSLGVGTKFVYNEMIERLMGLDGVYNVNLTSPAADQTPLFKEVYIPGVKTVTVA